MVQALACVVTLAAVLCCVVDAEVMIRWAEESRPIPSSAATRDCTACTSIAKALQYIKKEKTYPTSCLGKGNCS